MDFIFLFVKKLFPFIISKPFLLSCVRSIGLPKFHKTLWFTLEKAKILWVLLDYFRQVWVFLGFSAMKSQFLKRTKSPSEHVFKSIF